MHTPDLETRRVFIIAHSDPSAVDFCKYVIEKHITSTTVFTASDGSEALFKMDNVVPHVVVIDAQLPKFNGFDVTKKILDMKKDHAISVILLSEIPEDQTFVNEVVTGQVQFLTHWRNESLFNEFLIRALNKVSLDDDSTYRLKFLASNEILFHENEKAESVFIVKKGEMEAIKKVDQKDHILGKINAGEFVGEMAHFNEANRSATVKALVDCELIEIPMGTLDMVLFSKPAWARALVATLSKRLGRTNSALVKKSL